MNLAIKIFSLKVIFQTKIILLFSIPCFKYLTLMKPSEFFPTNKEAIRHHSSLLLLEIISWYRNCISKQTKEWLRINVLCWSMISIISFPNLFFNFFQNLTNLLKNIQSPISLLLMYLVWPTCFSIKKKHLVMDFML